MASYDIFTPEKIAIKMRSYLPDKVKSLLEPSVGTGDLLRIMSGSYEEADVFDVNASYLDKVEDSTNISKTCGDFLSTKIDKKYDAILMNPPYLRFQDMTIEMRRNVHSISDMLKTGNIDLYIAFLVKCIDVLDENGTLVAITPSTWRYNKSAEKFRNWLFSNRLVKLIYDYGSEKVFPGVDVYCCILVVNKIKKESYYLNDNQITYQVTESNSSTVCLGNQCQIQNGIATLCDAVFIHDTPLFAEPCWKPILKVSKHKVRNVIYPYKNDGTIIPEDEFREHNPETYSFLERNKERLANRDKGNKKYETWYAFGRKQGIIVPDVDNSVYISTLCPSSVPTYQHKTILFYSGIRITPTKITCDLIQSSIEKYSISIKNRCSKRANDWINITTSSLRDVPVSE
jgi:hypothetical protein